MPLCCNVSLLYHRILTLQQENPTGESCLGKVILVKVTPEGKNKCLEGKFHQGDYSLMNNVPG